MRKYQNKTHAVRSVEGDAVDYHRAMSTTKQKSFSSD